VESGRKKYLKKWEGFKVKNLYTDRRNKQAETETSKQKKTRERRLKQSTNSYKIYCGVEKNKCAVFKKKLEDFFNVV
tara:strand:- start:334 stop:564 length:231 start_codon:yes stop_codon:yes gene_type:complete